MATISRGRSGEKFRFIHRYGKELGVAYLCAWLCLSRSGYYAWRKRAESARSKLDRQLSQQIVDIHQMSRAVYGSPRVHQVLKQQGVAIGRKRVARLMQAQHLQGRVVKVTRRQPGLKSFLKRGENLLLNAASTTGIDQVWVADITYLKVREHWALLIVIMDRHSRRILSWSLRRTRTVDDTLRVLKRALKYRKPNPPLIYHTDRGIEFTGLRFREALKNHGLLPSVNRLGECTDNAHMESFFHTLKAELIRGRTFNTEKELRTALASYINQFYNQKRLHSGIGYCSPVDYEEEAA